MANSPLGNLKSRYEDLSNNPQIYTPSDTLPITARNTTTIPQSNESFWKKSTNFLFSEAKELGEDIAEYTSKDVKAFRQSNNELRARGGKYAEIADEMEVMYGKRPDNLAAKTLADTVQTLMWIAPLPGFKLLKGLPVLKKAVAFGTFGGVYAGMEGVGEGEKIDDILKRIMIGFGAGTTLGFAGHYFIKYGKNIPKAVSAVYQKAVPQEFRTALGNLFLPVGSRLSQLGKDAGQYGEKIMDGIKTIRSKEMLWLGESLSRMAQIGMLDMKGLIKSQTLTSKPLAERIDVSRRLRGFKSKIISEELDTAAQVTRAEYMYIYNRFGEVGKAVGYRENYFNQVILNPERQLSSLDKQAFKLAKTSEEKFAILNKDETRGNVFKWTIEDIKAFDNYDDAYAVWDDWATWVKEGGHKLTSKRGQALVKWMMRTGQAENLADANKKLLRSYSDYVNPLFNKSRFLENRREIDLPFYDPDPQKYIPLYLVDAIKRTAELSTMGPKGIDKLLEKLQKSTNVETAQKARKYVDIILGTVKKSPLNDADALSWIRSLNAPKLTFTQVTNLGQSLSTLMLSDLRGLAHGLTSAFKKDGVMEALKTGVGVQEILRANLATYRDTTWAGKWGDWNLKWSGFSWSERFNRVVAAHSFMDYTRRNLDVLLKNPTDKITIFRLQELNVNTDEALKILKEGGNIDSIIKQAGFTGANKTQFINLQETLPYWFTSPTGKMFTQFKSYSYNQVRLVTERLSGRVKAGDYAGLVRDMSILGIAFPMYGEVAEDFRALVSGKKRPMNWISRYFDNLTSAGAFGLGFDLFNTIENRRLANWMLGPTVGTLSDAIHNAYEDIMKGEISDKTYRMMFSQLGFPRVLNYRLFPPRKYNKPVADPLVFWEKIMK